MSTDVLVVAQSRCRRAERTVAFLCAAAFSLLLPNVFEVVLLSWFESLFDPARLTREDVDSETTLVLGRPAAVSTAWSVGLAVVRVAVVGWAGGNQLVPGA